MNYRSCREGGESGSPVDSSSGTSFWLKLAPYLGGEGTSGVDSRSSNYGFEILCFFSRIAHLRQVNCSSGCDAILACYFHHLHNNATKN
jgi:hypothetical protein